MKSFHGLIAARPVVSLICREAVRLNMYEGEYTVKRFEQFRELENAPFNRIPFYIGCV